MSEINPILHSAEHIFAQAISELYPNSIKLAVAHITDKTFANDAEWSIPVSEEMFAKIEARMKEIVRADMPITMHEVSVDEAKEMFKNNKFKLEWIEEHAESDKTLTVFWTGEPGKEGSYVDFCKGPHVKSTGEVKAFKLLSIAGAYWRGDAKKEMLTRVYGTAFGSEKELEEYLNFLEEAKRRDHRKIGKELGLFTFSELVGSGLPMFTPKGTILRQELAGFSEKLQKENGFQQVWIPHIAKNDLYKASGHWDKFGDELFIVQSQETSDVLVLKPMNCPHHAQIYASEMRSYKDLPLRFFETTTIYRDEKAGELSGLSRVRSITQDDAHIFCRIDQIENEFTNIMGMIQKMYAALGLKFRSRLSFSDPAQPEKYHGTRDKWDNAEKIIEDVAKKLHLDYFIAIGEAAFYGPKIDIMVTDALGREWQCATQQLDFVQPERFKLEYVDADGKTQTPVMIHKALLGSVERFLSIYIEHTVGAFPVWLHPEQVIILPVSEKHVEYAEKIKKELADGGIRVVIGEVNETLGNKIRKAQAMKVPYMIIVGDKEVEGNNISVRTRTGENMNGIELSEFLERIRSIIQEKGLGL